MALRQVEDELAEGDAPATAAHEVLEGLEADGLRASIRGGALGEGGSTAKGVPEGSVAGACAARDDESAHPWVACSASRDGVVAVVAVPTEGHREVVRTLGLAMAIVVVLAFLAIVAAARVAVAKPLGALRRLVDWSESVAVTEAPPPAPKSDVVEIERLAGSFDGLVKKLVDALARERATSAHVAHELRTPLTSIRAELEAAPPSEAVSRMLGDAARLEKVIDAILVLAAHAGAASESEGVVNVADVARDLAGDSTRVDAPDEALLDADPRLVELALANLLENARKHAGKAATAIRVTREGESVRVSVVDDGPGLDDAARAKMFDRYWRGGAGAGTGLGLALVRAVAERYGGSAEARRNGDGPGLEVAITFGRVLAWHDAPAETRAG